jgi:hypothetical protein
MTSTVRAATSAPSTLTHSSPDSLADSSPSPPQESHRAASGVAIRPSQPAGPQPSLHPTSLEVDSSPWTQVHPALIDQLAAFEAQIAPSPVVGGYSGGQSASSHTSQIPFPFPMSTSPASPPRFTYSQQAPRGHHISHDPQFMEGTNPTSAMTDTNAVDLRWGTLHTDMQPQFARPRTPAAGAPGRDRVIRQSGGLSLTEAWSQFLTQMDIPAAPQRPP